MSMSNTVRGSESNQSGYGKTLSIGPSNSGLLALTNGLRSTSQTRVLSIHREREENGEDE
ncbi:MAG: hypothetical protein OEW13_07170 [Nitrospira sp.]|nr:hypothetical protein [Nitrospira sp.]